MSIDCLIIDTGSSLCKAGWSGSDSVREIFPSVVGKPKRINPIFPVQFFVGDIAIYKKNLLNLSHPVQKGIVTDWEDVQKIWSYVFGSIQMEEHPVLLTEIALNPRINREKSAEIMFEKYKTPGLYLGVQSVLALYASGRKNGLVIDSGEEVTHVVPVYEGSPINHAIKRIDLGGRQLDDYLIKLLQERGLSFTTFDEKESVRRAKERLSVVSLDFAQDLQRGDMESYQLPDGNVIELGRERFMVSEAMFNPSLVGLESDGIHEIVCNSIGQCDEDLKQLLFQNLWTAGGNTLFRGFSDRVVKELRALTCEDVRIGDPNHKYSAWRGASLLASQSEFRKMCVSKAEYNEFGASIVHRKFF